jgi:Ca-activated chloride channel family protein
MEFLAPSALLLALFSIPIILLYMLKLRRREVPISSTFLWSQVLQDREANTPWQKLKRNLLLLLQLLILALMVLALMRPFVKTEAISDAPLTILLDASPSMLSTDTPNYENRWQMAQSVALDLIDTLPNEHPITVITVSDAPAIITAPNRQALRQAVLNAQPTPAPPDWLSAFHLALAQHISGEDFTLVVISDGGISSDVSLYGLDDTVDLRYIPIGTSGENVAITALSSASLPNQAPQLFAQITNYGTTQALTTLTIFIDGERFDTRNITLSPRQIMPIIIENVPSDAQIIESRITQRVNSPVPDHLAIDNHAYTVLDTQTVKQTLLISTGNRFIERVFQIIPSLNLIRTDGIAGIPIGFDLYILDEVIPEPLPDGNLIFINPPSDTAFFGIGGIIEAPENPRLAMPDDARLQFVDVSNVNFLRVTQLTGIEWMQPLIMVGDMPIVLAGEQDGQKIAVLAFNPNESDFPLQITWPILMANLAEWFIPNQTLTAINLTAGETLAINPPLDTQSISIINPDGERYPLNEAIFPHTDLIGIYQLELVQPTGTTRQPFSVNLFNPQESNIQPLTEAQFQIAGAQITPQQQNASGQFEIWWLAVVLALLVLGIEWLVYHQRAQAVTLFQPLRTWWHTKREA